MQNLEIRAAPELSEQHQLTKLKIESQITHMKSRRQFMTQTFQQILLSYDAYLKHYRPNKHAIRSMTTFHRQKPSQVKNSTPESYIKLPTHPYQNTTNPAHPPKLSNYFQSLKTSIPNLEFFAQMARGPME